MARLAPPVLILALAGAPFAAPAETLPLSAAQQKNLGIVTAEVRLQDALPARTYPARVTLPPTSVRVVAAAGEALVTRVSALPGDAVKRGAPLATLSMPGLAEAQHALTQARLKARLASSTAARDEKLFAEGLIAEARVRASQSEAEAARASEAAARTALALLGGGTQGSTLTLRAPIAGVVLESSAEPGLRVDAGTALYKLADLSKLALEIPLSTQQSRQVAIGQTVSVAGSDARGRVTALLPALDAAQSVLVRASLSDPQGLLRPGQSVEVAVARAAPTRAVVVPASALVWKGNAPHVFVATVRGFEPTPVELIQRNARDAAVTGLAAGARIAVAGVAALKAQWLEH